MEGDTEKSVISSLKTRSRASTSSYAKAKAKAKALEVNLEYVKKQTEIKRQRALLDAEFELISAQKDAAAAAAEAAALDTDSDSSNSDQESLFRLPMDKTKTEKYVETVQVQVNADNHDSADIKDPHGVTDGMDPRSVTDGKVPHGAADGMDPHGVTHVKDPHGVAVTADSHGAKGEMLHTDTYGVSDFVPRQSRQDVTSDFPAYLRGTPGYFSRGPEVPNAFLPNDSHGTPVFYPRQQDVPYLVQCIPPLPQPEIPVFKGDVLTYSAFMISFETRIESRVASNTDRLYYLYQYTDGEPKELISGCLYMPDGYKRARELLHKEYGNEYKISMAYLNKLLAWPAVRAEDSVGLKGLSVYLVKCHSAMLHLHNLQVLNHAPHMQAIVKKLPMYSQNRWRGIVAKVVRDEKRSVVFSDLVTFIEHESKAVNDPVFGREALKSEGPSVQTTRFPQTKTARTSPMKRTHTSHPPTPRTSAHPPGSSFAVITDQATMTWQTLFIAIVVLVAADEKCLEGPHHKDKPSPEGTDYVECLSWKQSSCCLANLTKEIATHKAKNLWNFHWDRCGNLSQACESYIKDEECFYQCEPALVRFPAATKGDVKGIPICAKYCNDWFEACKNDLTCVVDWLADFDFSRGENHCPTLSRCRTFADMYKNGQGLCERMWGKAFTYETSNNCMVMKFDPTKPNPNAQVQPQSSKASHVHFAWAAIAFGTFSLFRLMS